MAASFGLCILCSGVKTVGNTLKKRKKSPGALRLGKRVDQPENEHIMVNPQIQVHRLWHLFCFLFLAAITNTKVYQKKTLHVLEVNTEV